MYEKPLSIKTISTVTTLSPGIKDISVYNNDVYLFLEDSTVHRLTLLPIYQLFTVLSSKQLWSLSSSILIAAEQMGMRHAVMKRVKKDHLQSILAGMMEFCFWHLNVMIFLGTRIFSFILLLIYYIHTSWSQICWSTRHVMATHLQSRTFWGRTLKKKKKTTFTAA